MIESTVTLFGILGWFLVVSFLVALLVREELRRNKRMLDAEYGKKEPILSNAHFSLVRYIYSESDILYLLNFVYEDRIFDIRLQDRQAEELISAGVVTMDYYPHGKDEDKDDD